MNIDELVKGIQVIRKYYDDPNGYKCDAEHDIFYMNRTDRPIECNDLNTLIDLGWFQDDAYLGDDDEFNVEHYDTSETWAAHV